MSKSNSAPNARLLTTHRQAAKQLAALRRHEECISHLEFVVHVGDQAHDKISLIKVLVRTQTEQYAISRSSEVVRSTLCRRDFDQLHELLTALDRLFPISAFNEVLLRALDERNIEIMAHFLRSSFFPPQIKAQLTSAIDEARRPHFSGMEGSILNGSELYKRSASNLTVEYFLSIERAIRLELAASEPATARPSRLAIVTNSLAMGGNERNAVDCAIAYARAGLFEKVYLVEGDKNLRGNFFGRQLEAEGVEHVNLYDRPRSSGVELNLPVELERAAKVLGENEIALLSAVFREEQIDVVHSFASDARNAQVVLAALDKTLQFVGLNPGSMSPTSRPGNSSSEKVLTTRAIYRAVSESSRFGLFFCSLSAAQDYSDWGDIPFSSCNVNYVSVGKPHLVAKKHLSDTIVIGGAFRFHPVKEPMLWIDIAIAACQRWSKVRFAIAGDGELIEEAIHVVGKAGFQDRIQFLGAVDDMAQFYRNIDIFMHVAKSEGLGNVIIEAQSHAVPVVVRAVGGVPETLVHLRSGFLIEQPVKAQALERLQELVSNSDLAARMGNFGARFVNERYGDGQMLSNILGGQGRRSPGDCGQGFG